MEYNQFSILECFWYWTGIHYFHRGNKSISRRSTVGGVILFDAFHLGHRFTVRHVRRFGHITCRHETISESSERYAHRGNLLLFSLDRTHHSMHSIMFFAFTVSMHILLWHIDCIRSWCWQLHLSTNG